MRTMLPSLFRARHTAKTSTEPPRHVKSMEFSVIVFDTAPTGHTLRFLSFPSVLEKALGKLSSLSGRFGPMLQQASPQHVLAGRGADVSQMQSMFGGGGNQEDMFAKLEQMREIITEVNTQFKDPVRDSPTTQFTGHR